jgi:hypothetical protein
MYGTYCWAVVELHIMKAIGFRANPRGLTFAIYCDVTKSFVNVEKFDIPAAFEKPDGLKFLRNNMLDVFIEFNVQRAGIRLAESHAQKPNIDRIQIEGVIQEAFASSDLMSYFVGQIATIERLLGIGKGVFKPMIGGTNTLEIEGWGDMSADQREAMLAAIGALNA